MRQVRAKSNNFFFKVENKKSISKLIESNKKTSCLKFLKIIKIRKFSNKKK